MQGLFSFGPEILFEGDDQHVLQLFSKFLSVLRKSGCLSEGESVAFCEKFTTYVVDARATSSLSRKHAEDIPDVVTFLLADYSFLSRRHLLRVLNLCCLVVVQRRKSYPAVSFDLSGCAVSPAVLWFCITGYRVMCGLLVISRKVSLRRALWKQCVTLSVGLGPS